MSVDVLLVEDEVGFRNLIKILLLKMGLSCREAEEGMQALTLIRQAPPALMILDLKLAGMDGMTVLRMLKVDPPLVYFPVLVYTAYDLYAEPFREPNSLPVTVLRKGGVSNRQFQEAVWQALAPLNY